MRKEKKNLFLLDKNDIEVGKIIGDRDVIFDENTIWNWKEKEKLEQLDVPQSSNQYVQDLTFYPLSLSTLVSSSGSAFFSFLNNYERRTRF